MISKTFPGHAVDVAVASNGSIYCIGTSQRVFKWNDRNNNWDLLPNTPTDAVRLTVDKEGKPWITHEDNAISRFNFRSEEWEELTGRATDIAAATKTNDVFCVGTSKRIFQWVEEQNDWSLFNNTPEDVQGIAARSKEELWVLLENKMIKRFKSDSWESVRGGAIDISQQHNATKNGIYVIGSSKRLFNWDEDKNNWDMISEIDRSGQRLAVEPSGNIIAINISKEIIRVSLTTDVFQNICDYAPNKEGETQILEVILPGIYKPVEVTCQIYDGIAVLDGGIVLGHVDELTEEVRQARQGPSSNEDVTELPGGLRQSRHALVALRSHNKLWDGGVLPYQFSMVNNLMESRIEEAMEYISNNTNIEFVSASDDYPDKIIFKFSQNPIASSAELGRTGGDQYIYLNERFDIGGIVHEILHALGILHEHTRNDRDSYVQINKDNICPGYYEDNFKKGNEYTRDIREYDFNSIMHYGAYSFTRDSDGNICKPPLGPSIQPVDPSISHSQFGSARKKPPYLSNGDIAGLNNLYPLKTTFNGGHQWGSGNYANDIAFGDIDGDGIDEVVITRNAEDNERYYILNDANREFSYLYRGGGEHWGSGNIATCCATGDIDGDGKDEIVIGRRAGSGMRFEIIKYESRGNADQLFPGGSDWGSNSYTTDVAIGIDSYGTPLIGVTRKASSHSRFYVLGGASQNFETLFKGGSDWDNEYYATGIAFGDVDGDGFLEVGVCRRAKTHGRFIIYKAVDGDYTDLKVLHSGGVNWSENYYATAIAFGDVDGDGRDEIGVARYAKDNGRFFVYDSADQQFRLRHSGGDKWRSAFYATDIAMGDIDGDGRAEVIVGRKASNNSRFFMFDDGRENYLPLGTGGTSWANDHWATAVAIGNARVSSDRKRHIAVARKAHSNSRFIINEFNQ